MLTKIQTFIEGFRRTGLHLSQVHAPSHRPVTENKVWSLNRHTQLEALELGLVNRKGHRFSSGPFPLPEERKQRCGICLSYWRKERVIPASFQEKEQHVPVKALSQLSTISVMKHNLKNVFSCFIFFYLCSFTPNLCF